MANVSQPPFPVIFFDLGETLVTRNSSGTRLAWVPGARDVLAELRAQGVRLGVISNTGGLQRSSLLELLPTDFDFNLFEPGLVVLSSEFNDIEKPHPLIFGRAIDVAQVSSTHCLYCSESLIETVAAQRAGMCAARLKEPPNGDLVALLDTLARLSA